MSDRPLFDWDLWPSLVARGAWLALLGDMSDGLRDLVEGFRRVGRAFATMGPSIEEIGQRLAAALSTVQTNKPEEAPR